MAFRFNGPTTLALPPFRGATRRIILTALIAFFGLMVMGLYSGEMAGTTANLFALHPAQALGKLIWQFATYPFVSAGLIGTAFALLSLWFFGSALEDDRGSRWLTEYFLVATIGGGVVASLLSMATQNRIPGLEPLHTIAGGMWPFVMALILAYALFYPDQQIQLMFILTVKAKYLAAIYLLLYLAVTLSSGGGRFEALAALSNGLAGYLFLKLAPARGFRVSISERWFMMRNSYIRAKRRRAAKKFTVYMKKQGKEVSLDSDGRYIDPKGDTKDRKWMN